MKRIKTRCAFSRQHTLPHRRAASRRVASRSKPPQPAPRANWVGWIKRNGSAKPRPEAKLALCIS
nr:hypothetical protein [Methylomarinum sp. Ch1-1]MDP4521369.1 hypothetical protein [Methylomarinum sp. Ch1-1]